MARRKNAAGGNPAGDTCVDRRRGSHGQRANENRKSTPATSPGHFSIVARG